MDKENLTIEIIVSGVVQGVGFRPFIYKLANLNNIKGFIINMGNVVKIKIQGKENNIKLFLKEIKVKKPSLSIIENIKVKDVTKIENKKYDSFKILESTNGFFGNSIVPSDISICTQCINDMFNNQNNHYLYPFTTCVNCGPRYTILNKIPYDRKNTTMNQFNFCKICTKEYNNEDDRRYYAQGISCSSCGPKYILLNDQNKILEFENSIKKTAFLISKGYIIALKSDGGFNLVCDSQNIESIKKLRKRLQRPMQPFSVMCDSIKTAKTYGKIRLIEQKLLTSIEKPIVICNKLSSKIIKEMDEIAPNLHNIGLILPYTGTQILLFYYLKKYHINSIIDTSANIPGEPMIINNEDVFTKLKGIADYYLINNRKISHRTDDSVIRIVSKKPIFLRKSRGYVPEILKIPFKINNTILGLGSEMNNTIALLNENKVYLSQHIGNTKHVETNIFHHKTIDNYTKLLGLDPKIYVTDLHPNFNINKTGLYYSKKNKSKFLKIQHHHAHICSLMADNKMPLNSEIIGIALDGAGYGTDNTMWGGEIMHCTYNNYTRLAHLKQQPMVGGDKASNFPKRMLLGILATTKNKSEYDKKVESLFLCNNEHDKIEKDIIYTQVQKKINIMYTTSMGRILDSLSALFSICDKRTYDGEPAIKFESYLASKQKYNLNKINFDIDSLIYREKSNLIFNTTELFEILIELINKKQYKKLEIAKLSEEIIISGITKLALEVTDKIGIKIIGITGGVANNNEIVTSISKLLKQENIKVLTHKRVPSGDGGISLGQVVHAAAYEKSLTK